MTDDVGASLDTGAAAATGGRSVGAQSEAAPAAPTAIRAATRDATGDATPEAPDPNAAVEVRGVSRRFRQRRTSLRRPPPTVEALADVSLVIPRGARFGVVGESGSGKSTLMRLIAGLDRADAGRVYVDGVDITALAEGELGFLRRRLQMVFQDPMSSLDPRMTVGDIVAEPLEVQGRRDVTDRVERALAQVGLPAAVTRRYPHQFSGGQRQRISIARAIAGEPAILVADEAVSALDVTIRAQILQLLERIAAEGDLTLVFVSHDLSVVRRVCDRVAVLQAGRLVEVGATEQVFERPSHPYTRELLASIPTLAGSLALATERLTSAGGRR